MSASQLAARRVSRREVDAAITARRLYRVHRGVYSVTPPQLMSIRARLCAAILAGGPDACLCGPTAAWWLRLITSMPKLIHVAVRNARKPIPGIRWHRLDLQPGEQINVNAMPVTHPARVPLDMAALASVHELKGVLANLEYHHGIPAEEVTHRPGYAGTRKLKRAIAEHTPQLAETQDHLQRVFIEFLDERDLVLPEFNVRRGASTVDCGYPALDLLIELDGIKGHTGERRTLRDHRRDLYRRSEGSRVLRYAFAQFQTRHEQRLIEQELDRCGVPRRTLTLAA